MAGVFRQTGQHGDYDQAVPVWKASIAVAPGDFVYRESDGYDYPVSSYTWNTDLATTAGTLNALFRGVSMTRRSTAQATDGGRSDGCIIYTGEFEYPCAALGSAAKPGDLVTFAKQTGNLIENQKVTITATIGQAIGRVTEDAAVGATSIKFKLLTPLIYGGPTAAA
jgi:hypothetical protein